MTRIYANLLGNWIDITETGTVEDHQNPSPYFKENHRYVNASTVAECFKHGYINIQYNGSNYRIHPSCIQIVEN